MTEHIFHDADVEEIVHYFEASPLFSQPPDIDALLAIPTHIVTEREDIERFQEPDLPDSMINMEYNWNDIVQRSGRERSAVHASADYKTKVYFSDRIRNIMQATWLKSEQKIAQSVREDVADEIGVWINQILGQRAVCGVIPGHLTEQMWLALKSGGVPCGWYGGKDGMLAVYVPSIQE